MKKSVFTFFAVIMMVCLLVGCDSPYVPEVTPTVLPGNPTLHSTIYEDQKPEFTFTHIYGNENQQQTWFWVDCDISNAAIITINYDEEKFAPSIGEIVYSFGDVAAGEGILLYMEMPEGFPTHAITYTVGDKTYTYAMGYSGLDGSTTLTDFEELF